MSRPTPETDALECAFTLLKCSPIGNPENSSEYGRAAYILSEHCQGKEDVSEAAMRIFAKRIADLERERDEARSERNQLKSLNESYAACWDEIKNVLNESNQGDKTCDLDRVLKAIRERDEARKELEEYRSIAEKIGAVKAVSEKEKAIRERDEAREAWYEMQSSFERSRDEVEKLIRERDEALEALEYIAHAGLSARHIEDYAKDFLRRKEAAK